MKTGLLWFDDDPRKQLEEKVQRAATHYERKYGQSPTLCFVHPSVFSNGKQNNGNGNGKHAKKNGVNKVGGVEIRSGRSVLPNHFWLGIAEDKRQPARHK